MQLSRRNIQNMKLGISFIVISTMLLTGCLGGGSSSTSTSSSSNASSTLTPTEIAALTPVQIQAYPDTQIAALGVNIKYLSDSALQALANRGSPNQQLSAITAAQIATLTPAQVRMIGAAGPGGTVGTSQISQLNSGTWAALVSDPLQVAAITAAEVATLTDVQVIAMGVNINALSNSALQALANRGYPQQQLLAITAAQIATLTPAQVRMIGAAGAGGTVGTSQISQLNSGAWAALVGDPLQVAAITAAEVATFTPAEVIAIGVNINALSNSALQALANSYVVGLQLSAITAAQIATLTPAQVRMIGAAGPGGTVGTSQISQLNSGTWAALVSDPLQVAAITAAEVATLTDVQVIAMGVNINALSNSALQALANRGYPQQQLLAITAAQIIALSPVQIGNLAASMGNTGISQLNAGAFGALSPAQIAILTTAQKASLSAAQHTACGC